jgi:hypothetical protein
MTLSTTTDATSKGRPPARSRPPHRWHRARNLTVVTGAVAATLVMSAGSAAATPTCSDSTMIDVAVHGEHVLEDYLTGTAIEWPPAGQVGTAIPSDGPVYPGGPAAGWHFDFGVAPGASFCLSQSRSPGAPHDG